MGGMRSIGGDELGKLELGVHGGEGRMGSKRAVRGGETVELGCGSLFLAGGGGERARCGRGRAARGDLVRLRRELARRYRKKKHNLQKTPCRIFSHHG